MGSPLKGHATAPDDADALLALYSTPGHLLRRAKQKSTGTFSAIHKQYNITSMQWVVLRVVSIRPGVDQAELGGLVGLDNSTTGQIVLRLEQRRLLKRTPDGRRRRLHLTEQGFELLKEVGPHLEQIQEQITSPLNKRETLQFLKLLSKLVGLRNLYYSPIPPKR
jgi:DNA-binding MarR family transcriptional regulator